MGAQLGAYALCRPRKHILGSVPPHLRPQHHASPSLTYIAITRQIEHKLLKRGFQFNVMVVGKWNRRIARRGVCNSSSRTSRSGRFSSTWWICCLGRNFADTIPGQTGLGKSTLVNTLFASHLVDSKGRTEPDISARSTTEIHAKSQGE